MTALQSTTYPVHLVAAPDTARPPYMLVWSSAGRPSPEADAAGMSAGIDDTVGVTCVAGTPDGALIVADDARLALAGGVTVPGRLVWLSLSDSRPVQVDRDVTFAGTDTHPAYVVDLYRLQSTPA